MSPYYTISWETWHCTRLWSVPKQDDCKDTQTPLCYYYSTLYHFICCCKIEASSPRHTYNPYNLYTFHYRGASLRAVGKKWWKTLPYNLSSHHITSENRLDYDYLQWQNLNATQLKVKEALVFTHQLRTSVDLHDWITELHVGNRSLLLPQHCRERPSHTWLPAHLSPQVGFVMRKRGELSHEGGGAWFRHIFVYLRERGIT